MSLLSLFIPAMWRKRKRAFDNDVRSDSNSFPLDYDELAVEVMSLR